MFAQDTPILVVDDSFNVRRLICDNLEKLGFKNLVAVEDAVQGMSKLNETLNTDAAIKLVLSDLNMPGPSGIEFLKQVRTKDQFKNLPFILITTESEKGAVIEAAVNGVSGYIVKPFSIQTLTSRLQEAYKKHGGIQVEFSIRDVKLGPGYSETVWNGKARNQCSYYR